MRLLSVGLLALVVSLPAQADRLFTCGFEENNYTATMWETSSGNNIVTAQKNSGTYSSEMNGFLVRRVVPDITSGTYYWRNYFRFNVINATIRVGSVDSEVVDQWEWQILSTGIVRIINNITSTTADGSTAISIDTWYRAETTVVVADAGGSISIEIFEGDSETVFDSASITGEDTLSGQHRLFNFDGASARHWVDDVVLNDNAGAAPFNAMPAPSKIFLLKPSGDNTVTWTKGGSSPAATNFEGVDDVPGAPDDGVTYNSKTSNGTDKLDLTNLGVEVTSDADIIALDVYGRAGSNGTTGARDINFELWDEADANTSGPDFDCKINGWRIADTDEHLVFDAGSRTKANIDSFRIGYTRTMDGSAEIRITAEWINVEWIEAVAAAAAPRRRVIVID